MKYYVVDEEDDRVYGQDHHEADPVEMLAEIKWLRKVIQTSISRIVGDKLDNYPATVTLKIVENNLRNGLFKC